MAVRMMAICRQQSSWAWTGTLKRKCGNWRLTCGRSWRAKGMEDFIFTGTAGKCEQVQGRLIQVQGQHVKCPHLAKQRQQRPQAEMVVHRGAGQNSDGETI